MSLHSEISKTPKLTGFLKTRFQLSYYYQSIFSIAIFLLERSKLKLLLEPDHPQRPEAQDTEHCFLWLHSYPALYFFRTMSFGFLFLSGVFLWLLTADRLVQTATPLLRDFDSRNPKIVLLSMFLTGKTSSSLHICPPQGQGSLIPPSQNTSCTTPNKMWCGP